MSRYSETSIPAYLKTPPSSSINPPVETRKQELPFGELTWEDFEKLCMRLARTEADVEHCQAYGVRGQEQEGIDIYARPRLSEKYTVYQCKRINNFGRSQIKSAVSKFLDGEWVSKTDTFVLCTQASLVRTELASEIETQRTQLKTKGITLLLWDSQQLCMKLKDHSKLIDDFFGRAWVVAFCGQEQADALGRKPPEQDNSVDIDTLVQQVRSKVKLSIQERCGTMRVLDMAQPIGVGEIYTDVNILEKITGSRRLEIASLLQGFNPESEEFDRCGLGRVSEKRVPGPLAVERYSKLMVLGKPGAGKTTFLKYLAIQCVCGEFQANQVPIFITLKQFAETRNQPELLEFITQQWAKDTVTDTQIDKLINHGRVLILLDGLDEVREEDSSRVLMQIKNFSEQYHTNHFVITCRIGAREEKFDKFTEVEVADFNDEQIKTFVTKWYQGKEPNPSALFIQQLKDNKPIKELATNPLLLTLLCLVFQEIADFPSNRSELYREGVAILLKKWDGERLIKREQVYKKLSPQRKEDLLSQVALTTFERKDYFFKQREIEQYIADYIRNLRNDKTDPEALQLDSEAVLKSIEAQHGLLVERARGIYSFSHLTFQEYFTARAIVTSSNPYALDDKAIHNLVRHIYEKRWREVFLLSIGMVKNADILLGLMKYQVDVSAAQYRYLQELLTWANQKARAVPVSCPYKPATVRAFYLCLASGISMIDNSTPPFFEDWRIQEMNGLIESLDSTIGFSFEYGASTGFFFGNIHGSLDTTLSLDFDLNHARVHASLLGRVANFDESDSAENPDFDETHFLDDTHFYAIADALYNSLNCSIDSNLESSLESLYTQLPEDIYKPIGVYKQWSKTHSQSWAEELKGVINKHRNIDYSWQFSDEQWAVLRAYCYANKLLVQCLNSDCYVSHEVRQEIEDTLLLPIAEIEKYE